MQDSGEGTGLSDEGFGHLEILEEAQFSPGEEGKSWVPKEYEDKCVLGCDRSRRV